MKKNTPVFRSASLVLLLLYACNSNTDKNPANTPHENAGRPNDSSATAVVPPPPLPERVPNKSRYFYGPDTSVVTGRLSVETMYGPPGYGENPEEDAKEETYFLWLGPPVTVFANSPEEQENGFDVTRQDVDKIQVYSSAGKNLKIFDGKTIQVKGVLFGAHTGHHHADVLMDVLEMTEVR